MGSSGAPSLVWYVSRGSGMVAYVLLTASVVLGIAVSRHWHNERWPRLLVEASHRWLTIIFFALIGIHSVTILLDPFAQLGLRDVLLPFASAYRTVWLGLGVLASEVALAVALSVLIRRWIGYRLWHGLHLLTYLLLPLSLLHSLGTGTDTQEIWATLIYAASVMAVFCVLIWRTMQLRAWRRVSIAASLLSGSALLIWCLHGPYAAGWATAAGTPRILLKAAAQQRGGPTATATPGVPALPSGLSDVVSGQTLRTDGGNGLLLRGTGAGTTPLDVAIQLVQTRRQLSGEVQLRMANHTPWCDGPITGVSGQNTIMATCSGYGQQVQLLITLQAVEQGGFSGTLQLQP